MDFWEKPTVCPLLAQFAAAHSSLCCSHPSPPHSGPPHTPSPRAHSTTEGADWTAPQLVLQVSVQGHSLRRQQRPLQQSSASVSLPVPCPCLFPPEPPAASSLFCICLSSFSGHFHHWNASSMKRESLHTRSGSTILSPAPKQRQ